MNAAAQSGAGKPFLADAISSALFGSAVDMNWRRGFRRLGYIVSAIYWLGGAVIAFISLSELFRETSYAMTTKIAVTALVFIAVAIGYWCVYFGIRVCIWIGRGFTDRPMSTKDETGALAP